MTVVSVDKDFEGLAMTLVAEFDAPVERVWQLWADPRQLERWWGPPTHPATFERHDLAPGGEVTFFLTGPEGGRTHGWWRIAAVEPPRLLEFTDGFADDDGNPVAAAPVTAIRVRLAEHGDGTRMEVHSVFESREHMEQIVKWGAIEAFADAVGQMDALLETRR